MAKGDTSHRIQHPSPTFSSSFTYYPSSILAFFRKNVGALRKPTTSLVVSHPSGLQDLQKIPSHIEPTGPCQLGTTHVGERIAVQGFNLLNASLLESQLADPRSQSFSRQLYVDSLTYLLQGLPSELSEQEVSHLRSSLPVALRSPEGIETSSDHRPAPSMLHRGIATSIVTLCLLLRLAIPYVKYLLALAYNFERSHQVTEHAVAASITTVDTFTKKGTSLASTALENKMVVGTIAYCVEGICGGLNEGLGEGMKAMGAQKNP